MCHPRRLATKCLAPYIGNRSCGALPFRGGIVVTPSRTWFIDVGAELCQLAADTTNFVPRCADCLKRGVRIGTGGEIWRFVIIDLSALCWSFVSWLSLRCSCTRAIVLIENLLKISDALDFSFWMNGWRSDFSREMEYINNWNESNCENI